MDSIKSDLNIPLLSAISCSRCQARSDRHSILFLRGSCSRLAKRPRSIRSLTAILQYICVVHRYYSPHICVAVDGIKQTILWTFLRMYLYPCGARLAKLFFIFLFSLSFWMDAL